MIELQLNVKVSPYNYCRQTICLKGRSSGFHCSLKWRMSSTFLLQMSSLCVKCRIWSFPYAKSLQNTKETERFIVFFLNLWLPPTAITWNTCFGEEASFVNNRAVNSKVKPLVITTHFFLFNHIRAKGCKGNRLIFVYFRYTFFSSVPHFCSFSSWDWKSWNVNFLFKCQANWSAGTCLPGCCSGTALMMLRQNSQSGRLLFSKRISLSLFFLCFYFFKV